MIAYVTLFFEYQNPRQSEKRNNGVLDRLCQKKYYSKKIIQKGMSMNIENVLKF